ncbi:hypothetical protein SAMN05720606_11469 [Paenibacillus polysaccharolyticus]|uniref:Response regulator receiver domain-containing protein n=1 Tax=Paenibacillus polysaccharolyticus TaxID=582692 RepID=A0A1G5KBD4_9BACL|nr:hypothetical protein [Paenibacillus polysaccharolyticus]SCY97923.1 hypothetical protein SAMN05720606_11469 [Paenibacillus polysaccharolyticus]
MDSIKIIYIDDDPDESISEYLQEKYEHQDFIKYYEEVPFKSEEGYDNLLSNPLITEANIILIDSKLFENGSVVTGKFSGEEFKVILKKMFPFIEVLVISQNEPNEDYGTLQKYRSNPDETGIEYYARNLKGHLDDLVENITIYRNIANKLSQNDGIDRFLIEKITESLNGVSQYDELTTEDIDQLILAFKELQRELGE